MKKILISTVLIFSIFGIKAQTTTVIADDASNFLTAYFSPLGESFGAGLNNGWYNTAKPHKLLGFDITLTLNTVSIPNDIQQFNPDELDHFNSTENSPTLLGAGDGATIIYDNPNLTSPIVFTMPDQIIKKSLVPMPMVNAGIGVGKKTELDFRYLPNYTFEMGFVGKTSVSLWGVGVKHDLLQWIPVVGDAIPLSLSLQAGHTEFNTSFSYDGPSSVSQSVEMDVKATTVNIIASKKLLMLTAYAGIGYNSAQTTFNTNTNFELGINGNSVEFDIPTELNFETTNEVRANIGLRFNIAVLALQANHTFSKYPVTTVGVGLSLR